MKLEDYIKQALGYRSVQKTGRGGGGCISQGETLLAIKENSEQELIYAKRNKEKGARKMFDGEYASLSAIKDTECIKVPAPIAVIDECDGSVGAMFIMENLEIKSLSSSAKLLGEQLARMHMHNIELGKEESPNFESRFGFSIETCCGSIPQSNNWDSSWTSFYSTKLEEQIVLTKDNEAKSLWDELKAIMPQFFEGIEVKPSILHGDLWSGNAGTVDGKPVIFDAASFYGHHEYDLGIAGMFGGFGNDFYAAYHSIIPKERGFEQRHQLYKLFHNLNHWNHFGSGYRSSSLGIMKKLISFKR